MVDLREVVDWQMRKVHDHDWRILSLSSANPVLVRSSHAGVALTIWSPKKCDDTGKYTTKSDKSDSQSSAERNLLQYLVEICPILRANHLSAAVWGRRPHVRTSAPAAKSTGPKVICPNSMYH